MISLCHYCNVFCRFCQPFPLWRRARTWQAAGFVIEWNPLLLGSCGTPGSSYEVAVGEETAGGVRYAYIADGAGGLAIVRITPVLLHHLPLILRHR